MVQFNFDDLVKSIADETDTPHDTVYKMYAETWNECSNGARITAYLPLFVSKRVREKLRSRRDRNP